MMKFLRRKSAASAAEAAAVRSNLSSSTNASSSPAPKSQADVTQTSNGANERPRQNSAGTTEVPAAIGAIILGRHQGGIRKSAAQQRVTFRDEQKSNVISKVFDMEDNAEYNRRPISVDLTDTAQINAELRQYIEREMDVHKKSKDSAKHAFLHGQNHKIYETNAKKLRELRSTRSTSAVQHLAARSGHAKFF